MQGSSDGSHFEVAAARFLFEVLKILSHDLALFFYTLTFTAKQKIQATDSQHPNVCIVHYSSCKDERIRPGNHLNTMPCLPHRN